MDDGWWRSRKTCDERMWQGQWGAGADSSAFRSVTDWRSEADNGNNWGNFFSQSVAAEITVTAQGFKPATDNVPVWNLVQPYGAFLSSAPLCPSTTTTTPPRTSQTKWLHGRFCVFLRKVGWGGVGVKLIQQVVLWIDSFFSNLTTPLGEVGGRGEQLWTAIAHKSRSRMQQCR